MYDCMIIYNINYAGFKLILQKKCKKKLKSTNNVQRIDVGRIENVFRERIATEWADESILRLTM